MIRVLVSLLLLVSGPVQAHVRTVVPKPDEVIEIRTAVGIATIIQTPLPILPAITGDQSGFRVEYLEKSTIIKPLREGAKTNLFLLTNDRRYNLRLTTGPEQRSDYLVYLKEFVTDKPLIWKPLGRTSLRGSVKVVGARVALATSETSLIELKVQSAKVLRLGAEDFWLMQGGEPKIIESLYISKTKASDAEFIRVVVAVSKQSLNSKQPVKIEFRTAVPVVLTLSPGELWM
jgi:Conjugal transfer protein